MEGADLVRFSEGRRGNGVMEVKEVKVSQVGALVRGMDKENISEILCNCDDKVGARVRLRTRKFEDGNYETQFIIIFNGQ